MSVPPTIVKLPAYSTAFSLYYMGCFWAVEMEKDEQENDDRSRDRHSGHTLVMPISRERETCS